LFAIQGDLRFEIVSQGAFYYSGDDFSREGGGSPFPWVLVMFAIPACAGMT